MEAENETQIAARLNAAGDGLFAKPGHGELIRWVPAGRNRLHRLSWGWRRRWTLDVDLFLVGKEGELIHAAASTAAVSLERSQLLAVAAAVAAAIADSPNREDVGR